MELDCMRSSMRKLAIWHTPNFKPLTTHDELDQILSPLGFHPLPPLSTATNAATNAATNGATNDAIVWKEYSFSAGGMFLAKSATPPPRLILPYPRIDGLHANTYCSFLESLNFYLRMKNISDLFHIRGMPLHHAHDKTQRWIRMVRDDLVYVYREGTMDLPTASTNDNEDQNQVLQMVPWSNIMTR